MTRKVIIALGVYVGLFAVATTLSGSIGTVPVFAKPVVAAVQVLAAALVLARGVLRPAGERWGWTLLGLGALAWASGDVVWLTVLADADPIPVPSVADVGYLLLIPLGLGGLVVLARARTARIGKGILLDGVTASTAAGAVSAAVVLQPVLDALGEDPAQVATNLAYVLGDVLLLGVALGTLAVRGWRLDRTWSAVLAGLVLFWVADSHYLLTVGDAGYVWPNLLEIGWPAFLVLLAHAAWTPVPAADDAPPAGARAALLPLAFAAAGLAILVLAALGSLNSVAVSLAGASLLAVFGRLALALRENGAMLERSREEARTDALTGLGNRRALLLDLERRLAAGDAPFALVLFDLDGFKHYNDSFGHPAGDALLRRLAGKLAQVLPPQASGFRMGGDEFCVLAPLVRLSANQLGRLCALALSEEGDGFRIGCSFGAVALPAETRDVAVALRVADERLYAQKHTSRSSAGTQSTAVLLSVLSARDPELGEHLGGVADLSARVAEALRLPPDVREDVRRAGELHDVGKVAIPDAILDKPGGLDSDEWSFVRRHPVIGERILAAAPALHRVAEYVRASHERWDGGGYPDGLAGTQIPLGARIVAACDAYEAMRAGRADRLPLSAEAAREELRRCAGTQFDPDVVAALLAVLAASRAPAVVA